MADPNWDKIFGEQAAAPAGAEPPWDKLFITPQGQQVSPLQAQALAGRGATITKNALKAGTFGLFGQQEPVPGGPLSAEEKLYAGTAGALPAVAASALTGGALAPEGLAAVGALSGGLEAAAGAGAADLAHHYAPGVPYLPEALALGTSLGFAKGMTGVYEQAAARKVAAAEAGAGAEATAAQQRFKAASDELERLETLHKNPMDNPIMRAEIKANADEAAARQAAKAAHEQTLADAERGIQAIAKGTGSPVVTAQQFGERAQEIARNWFNVVKPQKMEAAANELYQGLPKGVSLQDIEAPIERTAGALGDINKSAGALEELAKDIKPRLGKQLQKTFEDKFESAAATKEIEGLPEQGLAGTPSKPVTLADQLQFRTILGDAMADSKITSDVGKENIKRLYAAISEDIRTAFEANGVSPEAWNKYNQTTSRLFHLAEGPVSDLISTGKKAQETIRPDKLTDKVSGSWLQDVRSEPELAEIADHYASHVLRGKVAAPSAAPAGGPLPGPQLPGPQKQALGGHGDAGAWHGLSPEAQAAAIPDPALRAQLERTLAARTEAPGARAEAERQALEAKQQAIAEAEKLKQIELFQAREAKKALAPQEPGPGKIPEAPSWGSWLKNKLAGALGEEKRLLPTQFTGAAVGELGSLLAGLSPEMQKAAVAAGIVAPMVYGQGKQLTGAVLKNPKLLQHPAATLAGAESQNQNQLMK